MLRNSLLVMALIAIMVLAATPTEAMAQWEVDFVVNIDDTLLVPVENLIDVEIEVRWVAGEEEFGQPTMDAEEGAAGVYTATFNDQAWDENDVVWWRVRITDANISAWNPTTIDPTPQYNMTESPKDIEVVDGRP